MSKKSERRAECEAKILRLLACEPMSNSDLADYTGLTRQTAAMYTKSMHKRRAIHVQGYRPATIVGRVHTLWGVGDKPDFVRILLGRPKTPVEMALQNKKDILATLTTARISQEIAAKTRLTTPSVRKYLQFLRKAGKVRIAGWVRVPKSRQWIPQYGLGSAPDAVVPSGYGSDSSAALGDDQKARLRSRATVEQTITAARSKPASIFAALGL